ncbi:MAG: flagellar assembly protein FliW [Actinomycetia bacterium]|nr:flagellar assembly protein FliW [Actinomycetes bacterium]
MKVIQTPDGFPGFASTREWVLEGETDAVFAVLRDREQPAIGLLVTEPWDLAPGYEPDLPDEELRRIGVEEATDVQLLVVATIAPASASQGDGADADRDMTIWLNLAAPIAISRRTNQARQVILDRQGWPLRHAVAARN